MITGSAAMLIISAGDIARALTYHELVEALRRGFRDDITLPFATSADATLSLMPARTADQTLVGCKLVTVFPNNATSAISRADLLALCRGTAPGRRLVNETTLFPSVGTALEDLVAATSWETPARSQLCG
jgi:ornithine cyclodeaminase/alanine dehydrogenase-like protein (mu-crystallin family)